MAGISNHASFGNNNLLRILEDTDNCVSSFESESEDSEGVSDHMQLSDDDLENEQENQDHRRSLGNKLVVTVYNKKNLSQVDVDPK
jgi:hypothetical protein